MLLAIETSCDETAVAIICPLRGVVVDQVYSQVVQHQPFGGVVPEIASRNHLAKLSTMVKQALQDAKIGSDALTGIAYTRGPGLVGALMVGASVAKGLALGWSLPTLGIHHIEGHLMSAHMGPVAPSYPYLSLVVSGGHTQLVQVNAFGDYEYLGETVDDAVGEAFDKIGCMLGFSYPAGAALSALAEEGEEIPAFPRPMTDRPGLMMSFSGLKTFARRAIEQSTLSHQRRADIARAFQEAIVDTLCIKVKRAMAMTGLHRCTLVGGVSANSYLQRQLASIDSIELYVPPLRYCGDNAAMIAWAALIRMQQGQCDESTAIDPLPRWLLTDLPCPVSLVNKEKQARQ